jgi:hypothetical protein
MCVYMHSRFVENHPIQILEDGPLISEVVLSQSMTIVEYVSKMKSLADDMASAGKKLDVEELSSYILDGLDSEYAH